MLVLGADACVASAGGVFVSGGGGGGVAEALSAEGGANLLAIALAFAFWAASCGLLVGWNRRAAVQGITIPHVSNPYLDEPGFYYESFTSE
jgi:hypothetical protein